MNSSSWDLNSKSRKIAVPLIAEVKTMPTRVRIMTTVLIAHGELMTTLPATPPMRTASVVANRKASRNMAAMNT